MFASANSVVVGDFWFFFLCCFGSHHLFDDVGGRRPRSFGRPSPPCAVFVEFSTLVQLLFFWCLVRKRMPGFEQPTKGNKRRSSLRVVLVVFCVRRSGRRYHRGRVFFLSEHACLACRLLPSVILNERFCVTQPITMCGVCAWGGAYCPRRRLG